MPKVYLNESERIKDRLRRWVIGEMKLQNVSQSTLAKSLGISQQMFSYKLKQGFSFVEFIQIVKFLKPDEQEMIGEIKRWIGV